MVSISLVDVLKEKGLMPEEDIADSDGRETNRWMQTKQEIKP